MYRSFCLMTLFAFILTLVAYTVAPAQVDPGALRKQHMEAIDDRGDLAGALALYTDDAVIDGPGLCAAAPCVGKAAIQKELERRVAAKGRATTISDCVSGNVLTSRFEVRSDQIREAGVERIVVWEIIEIRGDKISSVRGLSERTDPQTARFLEWRRLQQPAR